jgi:acyltransferase
VVWPAILGAVLAVTLLLSGTLRVGAFGGPLWGSTHATRPFTTFRFVSVLFFTAPLYRLVEKLPAWAGKVIALAGLIVAYLHGVSIANTPLAIGLALPCLIFVFAGRGLRIIRTRLARPAVIGEGLVTLSTVLVITRISAPLDIKPGTFGTPILSALVAVMTSAGVILVAEAVIPRLPGWTSRLSMTLAALGMLVVLPHPAVPWALNTPDHGRTVGFLGPCGVTAQTNSGG